jgi:hypothetical protein
MKFRKHTSDEMVELFSKSPFQGQAPEKASIVFLSSDANYSPEISNHAFFKHILEYQKDGIAFWKKHGHHHPFMLSNYPFNRNMAGVPFHRNFSKLGLGSEHAEHISFLELLDVPTIGNKSQDREQFIKLLSLDHLKYIESLILGGGRKLFFVSSGVLKDIEKIKKIYPVFACIEINNHLSDEPVVDLNSGNRIRQIYHFSSSQIHSQLGEIRSEIDQWLS